MDNLMKQKKRSTGNQITINAVNYCDAQYIALKLKNKDSKIDYNNFLTFRNVKYFLNGN